MQPPWWGFGAVTHVSCKRRLPDGNKLVKTYAKPVEKRVSVQADRFEAVRECANKSAASAASLDSVKFQAEIKSAAGAASLRGGRASGRLDHGLFCSQFLAALAAKKNSTRNA